MKVRDVMRTDVTTIEEDGDVALALQVMLWNGFRHLPVLRGDELVGILGERDLLAARPEEESFYERSARKVRAVMSAPARYIQPHAELADAAGLMSVHEIGGLPVVEDGRVVGLVTATDVLAVNAQYTVPRNVGPHSLVGDVMTRNLYAVYGDDNLLDAIGRMVQYGVRHLPVINALNQVVGMLSDRDVRTTIGNPMSALEQEMPSARLQELKVADAMTRDPRSVRDDAPLSRALIALLDERFGAIPVVDAEDGLVGLISYVDLLRYVVPKVA